MNLEFALRSTLEVSVVIPIGILTLLTFFNKLKIKSGLAMWLYAGVSLILSVIGGVLRLRYNLNINLIIFVLSAFTLIYLLRVINAHELKVLYIFISACAIITSIMVFGYLAEANYNTYATFNRAEGWGLVSRFILVAAVFGVFIPLLPKIRWLVDCVNIDRIWRIVWLVPFTLTLTNIIMIPHYFYILQFNRVNEIYIAIASVLLIMQLLFQFMVYFIAKTITEKTILDNQAQMLSIQAAQYRSMQRHIEATSKLRHDFKHIVHTAITLAQEGKQEDMMQLLTDYGIEISRLDKRTLFTKNTTLNALICYCYEIACRQGILCNWQVNLPEKLNIADIDLCNLVGNLLENAIHAAKDESDENRYITFKADVEENGDVYIVTTNGFSGNTRKEHDKYLSTKEHGSGLGLESIKTTVNRYNGFVKFYNDQKTFYADVMLKQNRS